MRAAIVLLLVAGCQVASKRGAAPLAPVPLPARVTGANVRPVGDARRGYGTEKARETMLRLRGLGVNTISVLMEGRMDDARDVEVRVPSARDLAGTRAALEDANALGFATVLIPHLYLDDGAWRGEIAHADDDAWWASYAAFVEVAADIAQDTGTTVLSIGVELKAMSAHPAARARIEALAARVRRTYRGQLTYNANWDEAEQVSFWSAVDLAGVNGYYPLEPDPVRGAEQVGRRLSALSTLAGREVIVLEVGYRASPMSHVRPWEWPEETSSADVDEGAQAQAWAAVLGCWLGAPGVRGLLVWVVPTDPDDPASEPAHGFNPLNRAAAEVISRAFKG